MMDKTIFKIVESTEFKKNEIVLDNADINLWYRHNKYLTSILHEIVNGSLHATILNAQKDW